MGAIATMGVIVGAPDYPMLMGAMIMGPLGGFLIKKFDQAMDGNMPAGFEMLINNFSVGIFGMILAIVGYYIIGPFMAAILVILQGGVDILINHGLLPFVAILLEPAKVLFLNNAINHGIFTPIGVEQAATAGKSIMYMLETNPGPGVGMLFAYWVFSKDRATKDSAPGAIIIQFFGGIHEIYFPYILMNPPVILGPILGNMCAIFWFSMTGAGLVGPAAPGSIIAFMSMAAKDSMVVTFIGVVIAAVVSFLVSSIFVRMAGDKSLEDAQKKTSEMKAESKGMKVDTAATGASVATDAIKKIIFACDAGMGSSAMGATKFRNRIKPLNLGITVTNTSVDNVPGDADVVVCQYILQDRAVKSAPQARLVTLNNFLQDPNLDSLYKELEDRANGTSAPAVEAAPVVEAAPQVEEAPAEESKSAVLLREGVRTGLASVDKFTAIRTAGQLLCDLGFVDEAYIDAMVEREGIVSTYMGMGVAIPHGTSNAKETVKKSGIVVTQYPDGVDFGDEKAYLVIGIAGVGDEHLEILGKIVGCLEDEELLEKLKKEADVDLVMKTFS